MDVHDIHDNEEEGHQVAVGALLKATRHRWKDFEDIRLLRQYRNANPMDLTGTVDEMWTNIHQALTAFQGMEGITKRAVKDRCHNMLREIPVSCNAQPEKAQSVRGSGLTTK